MNQGNKRILEQGVKYSIEQIVRDTIMYSKNTLEYLNSNSDYAVKSMEEQQESLRKDKEQTIKDLIKNVEAIIADEVAKVIDSKPAEKLLKEELDLLIEEYKDLQVEMDSEDNNGTDELDEELSRIRHTLIQNGVDVEEIDKF